MTHQPGGALRAALVALVAAVVLLGGCSSGSGPAADTASDTAPDGSAAPDRSTVPDDTTAPDLVAPEGYTSVTLRVTRPDGTVEEWCVWLAATADERSRGLMGVTDPDLGGRDAMVFTWPTDTAGGFWMKDTLLPLSIAWYAADGSFVADTDMDPCPEGTERCPSYAPGAPYRYAVEVPEGGLEELGLVEGSTVELGDACSGEASSAA